MRGQHNAKQRDGVLLRFYLYMKTLARKQIPALVMRKRGRDLDYVQSLTFNSYSFNFNTLSPRKREKDFRTLLQKKVHSVSITV